MKKIKVGGGGIDADGNFYRYEEEVEVDDNYWAEMQKAIERILATKYTEDSNKIIMSKDAYEALRKSFR